MDCTEVEAHLPLFVGGDLETPLAVKVESHLAACEGCGVRLEAAGRARAALVQLAQRSEPAQAGGRQAEVDLWPGVRALLLAEGLVGSSTPAGAAPVPARVLSFARYFGGAAAAAVLTLLFWRPWVPEPAPGWPAGAGPEAPAVGSEAGPAELARATSVPAGWLHRASAPALNGASPLLPVAAPGTGGLRRVGPDDELLRDRARLFPDGPTMIHPSHLRGQGGWSLASDGELR